MKTPDHLKKHQEAAIVVAKKSIFDTADYTGEKWKGFHVFYGEFILKEGDPIPMVGKPYFILVDENANAKPCDVGDIDDIWFSIPDYESDEDE